MGEAESPSSLLAQCGHNVREVIVCIIKSMVWISGMLATTSTPDPPVPRALRLHSGRIWEGRLKRRDELAREVEVLGRGLPR